MFQDPGTLFQGSGIVSRILEQCSRILEHCSRILEHCSSTRANIPRTPRSNRVPRAPHTPHAPHAHNVPGQDRGGVGWGKGGGVGWGKVVRWALGPWGGPVPSRVKQTHLQTRSKQKALETCPPECVLNYPWN